MNVTAETLQNASEAVMQALDSSGLAENLSFVCAVLGGVSGAYAMASENPQVIMEAINQFAQGIISGELLEDDHGKA